MARRVWLLWGALLCFRVLGALLQSTTGPPDEYWQGPEVAYTLVFGVGELTWEWRRGLRGWLHPLLFAAPLWLLRAAGLDSGAAVIAAPRVVQGLLAWAADLLAFVLARLLFPSAPGAAPAAVFLSATSWFAFYGMQRTFSNSAEAAASLAAFCLLPHPGRAGGGAAPLRALLSASLAAGVAVALRPTALLLWGPLLACSAAARRGLCGAAGGVLACAAGGLAVSAAAVALDTALYGRFVVAPLEFVRFNVLSGGAAHFGTHPFHWYFTQGLPAVLGTHLVWFLLAAWAAVCPPRGMRRAARGDLTALRMLVAAVLWVTLAHSVIGHKEFRFLLPALHPALVAGGYAFAAVWPGDLADVAQGDGRRKARVAAALLLHCAANAAAVGYFGFVHQRGTLALMSELRGLEDHLSTEHLNILESREVLRADLLMPCHQAPGPSYLHRSRITHLRMLDCSLRFGADGQPADTEHSLFGEDPDEWAEWAYGRQARPASTERRRRLAEVNPDPFPVPQYIAVFSHLEFRLTGFLGRNDFYPYRRWLHSPTPFEEGTGEEVVLWKRNMTRVAQRRAAGQRVF
eukprot:TRINITY_DN33653_c0_g1_i2.p2 TRINITY_DN33653_c0_g1~~TRINITY_DN33653_c0_g1_i2.p2  ORF type:complete len:592 (+),score=184.24 TRINITY_DN33653_c0_g1_i2:57-1778(+)